MNYPQADNSLFQDYKKCLSNLNEALDKEISSKSSLIVDGTIKRFSLTLNWHGEQLRLF